MVYLLWFLSTVALCAQAETLHFSPHSQNLRFGKSSIYRYLWKWIFKLQEFTISSPSSSPLNKIWLLLLFSFLKIHMSLCHWICNYGRLQTLQVRIWENAKSWMDTAQPRGRSGWTFFQHLPYVRFLMSSMHESEYKWMLLHRGWTLSFIRVNWFISSFDKCSFSNVLCNQPMRDIVCHYYSGLNFFS